MPKIIFENREFSSENEQLNKELSNHPNCNTAPQNFDQVERYVSNLPVDRVEKMRFAAEMLVKMYNDMDESNFNKADQTIIILSGYIMQLTEPNK